MRETYLEVTFRGGQPLAAYLFLPRQEGDRSARVEKHRHPLAAVRLGGKLSARCLGLIGPIPSRRCLADWTTIRWSGGEIRGAAAEEAAKVRPTWRNRR